MNGQPAAAEEDASKHASRQHDNASEEAMNRLGASTDAEHGDRKGLVRSFEADIAGLRTDNEQQLR